MLLLPLLLACHAKEDDSSPAGPDPYDVPVGPYEVEIRWTAWGVPHIVAADHGSLAYGMGYAFARDHACVLADQVVRARSERARYYGRGDDDRYVNEDFGWLGLGVYRYAEEGFLDLPDDIRAALIGYAQGYDRYIEEHADALPEACRGAEWVKPITHVDLLAYYLLLGENGSGKVFVDAVGTAAPPGQPTRMPPPPLSRWTDARLPPIGSNGWALGRDRTAAGTGMMLSNTHFPSTGELQWHESHLTIPGEMDVYGASLMGVPVINVGFNRDVAWTHTVSYTPRFTAVLLSLDPDDPLRYRYGDGWKDIRPEVHEILVRQGDGSLVSESRTLYRSDWGPVLNAPALGWNSLWAVALKNANENNNQLASTWLALNKATSLDEVEAAVALGGDPWVHLMAADRSGEVLYADPAATPNWSAAAEARYPDWVAEQPLAALFDEYGAITVDGADPTFEWVEEEGAGIPGHVPYARAPKVRRTDFVVNANDNYWLPNPASPLSGAPYLYGAVETPRSARTRMHLRLAGESDPFTLDTLATTILAGRADLSEDLRAAVAARCEGVDTVTLAEGNGAGETVELAPACAALAGWGGTVRLDDPGAPLWREFVGSGVFTWDDTVDGGLLYGTAFDPADPVDTPRDLAPVPAEGDDPILQALGHAAWQLGAVGVAVDATYRETQYQERDGVRYPVPGATYWEGSPQIATYDAAGDATLLPRPDPGEILNPITNLTADGYPMNDGNSYVLVVELGATGPAARAIMTYSASEDPASPHYADQTELYGSETLRPVLFEEADILADPELELLTLTRAAD